MLRHSFHPEIYAIDFGTSNSLLAAVNRDATTAPIALDPSAPDPTVMRSLLYFSFPEDGHTTVRYGSEAVSEYVAAGMQGRLIRSVKKHLPSRTFVGTHINDKPMNLEHLVGAFLGEMRRRANDLFNTDVRRVLLGRPARFSAIEADDRYGQLRLEQAARIAGFEQVDFCPEPLAAARHYHVTSEQLVVVADFGGGTSDFTVMRMRPAEYDPADVLAMGGVSVAGDALDGSIMRSCVAQHFGANVTYVAPLGRNEQRMPQHIINKLCSPADLTVLRHRDMQAFLRDLQRWALGPNDAHRIDQLLTLIDDGLGFSIFEAIEKAKRALSTADDATVRFEYPPIDITQPVSLAEFDQGSRECVARIAAILDETLRQADVAPNDVALVCCTGGTARVRSVARMLQERFTAASIRHMESFHAVIGGLTERAQSIL